MAEDTPREPRRLTQADFDRAAAEFRLPPEEARKLAQAAKETAFTIEQRQFGVDGEIREDFHRLYQQEVEWLNTDPEIGGCPLRRIGASAKDTRKCRVKFRSFEHFLVHHHMHLMIDGDARTQKITNESARELVHPTSEKTLKAALGPKERQRMMQDPEFRKRLSERRSNGHT